MKKFFFFSLVFLFSLQSFSQKNWKPFAGLHISSSNDFYYIGPSFSGGAIHPIGKKGKWSWVPEIQYFKKSDRYPINDTDTEWDKFTSFSVRSNFNYQVGKKTGKGFFLGGGFGFQKASDECYTITQTSTTKQKNVHYNAIRYGAVMFTFNAGYSFPLKNNRSIQAILSTIGPQTAKDDLGTYIEVVSLFSAGARIVL